ncbi:hypothetical protein TI39_contig604g00003 [Zymoseptoria brevis]|uniref:Velvet domain-containing protein n=1 Tax=Zymoseptoria brevis TaxID=1047168 RepID=A0A0F4GGX8_9PEZI|nr:hypothetical protein TI39_contig604g00003 [Zymoseptoria brevis]
MSPSTRPSPVQPPFETTPTMAMAQAQSQRQSGGHHLQGVQLPPIHLRGGHQNNYGSGGSSTQHVKLPPIQMPSPSPPRTNPPRAISVAQLLSQPSSPPRSRPTLPAYPRSYHPSPTSSFASSPVEPRSQPPHFPSHRLDHAPAPFRQPASVYQLEQFVQPPHQHQHHHFPRSHPPSLPSHPAEQVSIKTQPYSPALSGYSSPTSYRSYSDASPRSSLPPLKACPPPNFNYSLTIRQQPVAARACGYGERDRRVIDPPPILEMKITDPETGYPALDSDATFALYCNLLSPDSEEDETELPSSHPDLPPTRRLMGQTVASAYQAKDEHGVAGTFFVFPDLSCRSPGRFRLRFKMLRMDPMQPTLPLKTIATAVTNVFSVYTAKDFPGMRASSGLLKALRRQGLCVGVKKGSEARKGKGKAKAKKGGGGSDNSEDEGGDDSEGSDGLSDNGSQEAVERKKKGKRRKTRD